MTPNQLRAKLQPFPGAQEALDLMDPSSGLARGMTPPLRDLDEIDKLASVMTLCGAMTATISVLHARGERTQRMLWVLASALLTDLVIRIWQAVGQ